MNWNLQIIYKTKEEFNHDLKYITDSLDEFEKYRGKLNNKETIELLYQKDEELSKVLEKLYTYAHMNYDLNQKSQEAYKIFGSVTQLYSTIVQKTSFVNSELVQNNPEEFKKWANESKLLKEYEFQIEKLYRNKKHILDDKLELVIANYANTSNAISDLYDKLATSDNSDQVITLSDSSKITINQSNFRLYLEKLESQEDRRIVFETIFKYYDTHKNTFAQIYNILLQESLSNVKNRGYESILDSYLYKNNIPKDVYLNLINTAKDNTNLIKKYYEIRRKYFKLEKIQTYDRFLNFKEVDVNYDYEKCKKMFLEAADSIGGEFAEKARAVLKDGIVDVAIKDGKRSGAYSTGVYGVSPFILLNHSGTLDDLFTLAHEAGHSMHTMYSNESQNYATCNYTIFVAEIASTFNEQLMLDYMINNTEDNDLKIVLLQQAIDSILATFFRQSLFATYEYEASKLVENGEVITSDELSSIMINLYQDYYNIDIKEEKYKEYVWAYIPHFFHSSFYVYQYATSFAASLAIYERVKNKEENAFNDYLNLLKAGGSMDPVELVKKANVDLTDTACYKAVVDRLDSLIKALEKKL